MPVTISSTEIMEIFDIASTGTLTKWKEKGADAAVVDKNKWDLKAFLAWWLENIHEPINPDDPSMQAERLRWERGRADKIELEVARMKGELLPRADIEAALAELILVAKKAFMLLPKTAPGVIVGLQTIEMMGALQGMTDEILKGLSDGADIKKIEKKIRSTGA